MKAINKKTIKEGVFFAIGKNSRSYMSCAHNIFRISRAAADLLKLDRSDYVEFMYEETSKQKYLYIKKSVRELGFKAVLNPEKTKYFYRFSSVAFAKYLFGRFNRKNLIFELKPCSYKNALRMEIVNIKKPVATTTG